jgi:hypothetical protein
MRLVVGPSQAPAAAPGGRASSNTASTSTTAASSTAATSPTTAKSGPDSMSTAALVRRHQQLMNDPPIMTVAVLPTPMVAHQLQQQQHADGVQGAPAMQEEGRERKQEQDQDAAFTTSEAQTSGRDGAGSWDVAQLPATVWAPHNLVPGLRPCFSATASVPAQHLSLHGRGSRHGHSQHRRASSEEACLPSRLLHGSPSSGASSGAGSAGGMQHPHRDSGSGADVYELPGNVHLLTMKQLGPRKLLVRLAHLFQVSESSGGALSFELMRSGSYAGPAAWVVASICWAWVHHLSGVDCNQGACMVASIM